MICTCICGKVSRELNYEGFGHQAQEFELGLEAKKTQLGFEKFWQLV